MQRTSTWKIRCFTDFISIYMALVSIVLKIPKYSSPSTTSKASFGKHLMRVLANLVWIFVSQIIKTCNKVSPSDPRNCICQQASWSIHFPRGSYRLKDASMGSVTCSWSLNFQRKYSDRFIICPLPSWYISCPNCSRISFSTSACPPTLYASISSPPNLKLYFLYQLATI